jgi:hypothetical protein
MYARMDARERGATTNHWVFDNSDDYVLPGHRKQLSLLLLINLPVINN